MEVRGIIPPLIILTAHGDSSLGFKVVHSYAVESDPITVHDC
jgi:hypothetical protein